LRASHAVPQLAGKALSDFVAFHIPGHFFWSMKSPSQKIQALALMAIPPLVAWRGLARPRISAKIVSFATVAFFIAQILLLQVAPSRFLFQLHLFRSDVLCYALAEGMLMGEVFASLRARDRRETCAWICVASMVSSGNFLSALGLLLSWLLIRDGIGKRSMAMVVLLVAAVVALQILLQSPYTWITMFLLGCAVLLPAPRSIGRMAYPSIAALVFLSLVVATYRAWKIDFNRGAGSVDAHSAAYDKALASAREGSSPDDLFTVPPSRNTRAILQRGVYYSIWDGAGFLWYRGHELEVLRRMRVLGIPYTPGVQNLPDSIDRRWAAGLCSAVPALRKEGVTRAIVPVRDGRIDMDALEFRSLSLDGGEMRTLCTASGKP